MLCDSNKCMKLYGKGYLCEQSDLASGHARDRETSSGLHP